MSSSSSLSCSYCTRAECHKGHYCPAHYSVAVACPASYYCPDYSTKILCPAGHSCRSGSFAPTRCNALAMCPAGTGAPLDFSLCLLMFATLVVWGIGYYLLFTVRDRRRALRNSKREAIQNEIELVSKRNVNITRTGSFLPTQGAHDAMLRKTRNLNLGFRNLTVDIGEGPTQKRIIDNASGDIRAGRLTAILGPSGAGKSSFLHVIGGRLRAVGGTKSLSISGDVLINGERRSMHSYRRVIGFVPQDDVVHSNLTPKDSFFHISGLRLPESFTRSQRKELVNNVIALLDLHNIRHETIGSEKERGISGGQRKRVNIGLELVSDPWMLFLDEPTSGLDSAGAFKVVEILRRLADLGLTVVCVLHQPRVSIFELLDDVVLLGSGGRLVYSGPRNKAKAYFKAVGFEKPRADANPADWITDVVAGSIRNVTHPHLRTAEELQKVWLDTREARFSRIGSEFGGPDGSFDSEEGGGGFFNDSIGVEKRLFSDGMLVIKHPRWGRPEQRKLYLRRAERSTFSDLVWCKPKATNIGMTLGQAFFADEEVESMSNVLELREGITTKILERTGVPHNSHCYLSVLFEHRSLDLECSDEDERNDLFICLQQQLRSVERSKAVLTDDEKRKLKSRGKSFSERINALIGSPTSTTGNSSSTPAGGGGGGDTEKDKQLRGVASAAEISSLVDILEYHSDSELQSQSFHDSDRTDGDRRSACNSWSEDSDVPIPSASPSKRRSVLDSNSRQLSSGSGSGNFDEYQLARNARKRASTRGSVAFPAISPNSTATRVQQNPMRKSLTVKTHSSSGADSADSGPPPPPPTPSTPPEFLTSPRSQAGSPKALQHPSRMRRLSAAVEKATAEVGTKIKENFAKMRKKKETDLNRLDPLSRQMPSLSVQINHYLLRSILVQTSKEQLIDLGLICLSGLSLGLVYRNVEETDNELYSFAVATMAFGIMCSNSVERYFPSELSIFLRESSSGCSSSAYFIGKNVANVPFILVSPLFFCTFFVTFASPRIPTIHVYLNLVLVAWACTGAGYFLSLTFKAKAQLACVFYPLLSTMFAGVNPTLPDLKRAHSFGFYAAQASYSRWSLNYYWLSHASSLDGTLFPDVEAKTKEHGFGETPRWTCAIVLFAIGLAFRCAAFAIIKRVKDSHKNSNKKYVVV